MNPISLPSLNQSSAVLQRPKMTFHRKDLSLNEANSFKYEKKKRHSGRKVHFQIRKLAEQYTPKLLKSQKAIKNLKLTYPPERKPLLLFFLRQYRRVFKALQTFTFMSSFQKDNWIRTTEIHFLWKCIGKRLNNIKHFKVDFPKSDWVKDSTFQNFNRHIIKKLSKLESFGLTIQNCQNLTDEGFAALGLQIGKGRQSLKNLDIVFNDHPQGTETGIPKLIEELLHRLHHLQSLNLSVIGFKNLTRAGLAALLQSDKISSETLRCLKLEFPQVLFNDDAIGILGANIANKLRGVTRLCLVFPSCLFISEDGLRTMMLPLSGSLKDLKHLELNFSDCKKLTGEGISSLMLAVANFKDLHTLILIFSGYWYLNDQGVNAIGEQIGSNFLLKHLHLDFSGSEKITDESLILLAVSLLSHLQTLQNFCLNLSKCQNITNETLRALAYTVENIKELKHLELDFSYCESVTEEGMGIMRNAIEGDEWRFEFLRVFTHFDVIYFSRHRNQEVGEIQFDFIQDTPHKASRRR